RLGDPGRPVSRGLLAEAIGRHCRRASAAANCQGLASLVPGCSTRNHRAFPHHQAAVGCRRQSPQHIAEKEIPMLLKVFSNIYSRRTQDIRRVEAEAFYQGAHGVEIKSGLDEIQAKFDKQGAQLTQQSIERQKKFETVLDHVKELWTPVEKLCVAVRERIGDRIPPFLLPMIVATGAIFIAIAEA